jgi:acetoin utilization deacetylase AcuC-like enzyme
MFQSFDERRPVAVVTHPAMAGHGHDDHDEHPGRLHAALAGVASAAAAGIELVRILAQPVTAELAATVHTSGYLTALAAGTVPATPDNPFSAGTWAAVQLAAGAGPSAVAAWRQGGPARACAVVRPPGHHAHADRAGGFCYLNNAVITAMAFRQAGCERIALLDLDYHHGDGSAALVERDPGLFYGSVHADPGWSWPGTGAATDHPRLCHLPLGRSCGDARWLAAVDHLLIRAEAFKPAAVVLSFGTDALAGDPVGDLAVSQEALASAVRRTVRLFAHLPLVSLLEGGYAESALSEAMARHLHALAG